MAIRTMNLTKGPVLKQFVIFSIPIILSNMLQQCYHAADVVVVGNFAENSKIALAAVGSTGTITTLLLNLILGVSMGCNVVCANYRGAGNEEGLRRAMGTSLIIAMVSGVFISIVGVSLARPLLQLMQTPETVIGPATTYMRIIFLGQPAALMYNFSAGILRAHGDTKTSMYILSTSGLVNVALNLVFVCGFHLDEAGVALATIVANYFSAIRILRVLFSADGEYHLDRSILHFHKEEFYKVLRIGIPGGLNGIVFSISNVILASSVNILGDTVVAAHSAATNLVNIVYQFIAGFYSAAVSFSGQNYGAKRLDRIHSLLFKGASVSALCVLSAGTLVAVFSDFFLGLFTSDLQVIATATPKLYIMGIGYALYGISEMPYGILRGMGYSSVPTLLNLFSICLPRILWVMFVFSIPAYHNYVSLLYAYPVSWVCSIIAQWSCYFYCRNKELKKQAALVPQEEPTTI